MCFAAVCLFCLCGFAAVTDDNAVILDFGRQQVRIDDEILQGGWFNYDAKQNATNSKTLQERAQNIRTARAFEMAFPDIVSMLNKIIPAEERFPDNGRVVFHPHAEERFTVTGQRNGRRVNRQKLYADILTRLHGKTEGKITVEYSAVAPMPEAEIVRKIVKRGDFSTHFETNAPRERNMELAVERFNGLTAENGAEISFNKVVGRRSGERGYQEAKIIINGEYVEGIGGGVCQVSTTVFNAAVRAGLHITESRNHSLQSSYVPLGHDAMVAAAVDLRFINNTGAPIYFETAVRDNRVSVTIYGRGKGIGVHYKLSAEVTKEFDPAEVMDSDFAVEDAVLKDFSAHPENYDRIITQNGEKGYAVTTYIEAYKGGRLLSKKTLRRSTYRARPTKYKIVRKTPPPATDYSQ